MSLFFKKLGIRFKDRLIRGNQSHRPLAGPHSKPEQSSKWTCPPKLAPEGIEPETFRGAHSKILSQPLGQPQMGLSLWVLIAWVSLLVFYFRCSAYKGRLLLVLNLSLFVLSRNQVFNKFLLIQKEKSFKFNQM